MEKAIRAVPSARESAGGKQADRPGYGRASSTQDTDEKQPSRRDLIMPRAHASQMVKQLLAK
jgi:hypothetical protein